VDAARFYWYLSILNQWLILIFEQCRFHAEPKSRAAQTNFSKARNGYCSFALRTGTRTVLRLAMRSNQRGDRAKAGLPRGLSAHGLRKATCRRLAEAGATANEIMVVSGHNTLSEAARYTAAADQEHLACAAFERMGDLPCTTPVFAKHDRLHTLIWGAGTAITLPADGRYTNSVGANNRKTPN
jgi:hypothetical protein